MTFTIDTGPAPSVRDHLPDWFKDTYGDQIDAISDDRLIHDFGYCLIGEAQNRIKPKTLKTVRDRWLFHWGFIRTLAETHPDVFDELIVAYAERANGFD